MYSRRLGMAEPAPLRGAAEPFQCGKLPSVNRSLPLPTACELYADRCMCSSGCSSTFACTPSPMCESAALARTPDAMMADTAILLFFHFNRTMLRLKHLGRPDMALSRELHRLEWLLRSVRRVRTQLPVHVVVAGERNASLEARLVELGATSVIESPPVRPPRWTSAFHKLSFSRIAALALTQFRKVVVLDNDMTLLDNIDELAWAPTPSMVFHTATVLPRKERSAPTGGLFVLRPSRVEFERALAHLYALNPPKDGKGQPCPACAGKAYRCYDGSDQEFWRSFYRPLYELPLRYHAHTGLVMNTSEWRRVRLVHNIAGFRAVYMRLPSFVRQRIRFFHGDDDDAKKMSETYKM